MYGENIENREDTKRRQTKHISHHRKVQIWAPRFLPDNPGNPGTQVPEMQAVPVSFKTSTGLLI
jgi:hypothetical protein